MVSTKYSQVVNDDNIFITPAPSPSSEKASIITTKTMPQLTSSARISHKICGALPCHPSSVIITLTFFLLFIVILCIPVMQFKVRACIATTILMAVLWVQRYVPIGITSFIPVVVFPICGIASAKTIASVYYSDTVFLLIGTCIIGLALERTNALTRIAFKALTLIPPKPRLVLFVFMSMTAMVSIFVSNTAAAAVICPIVVQLRSALLVEDNEQRLRGSKGGGNEAKEVLDVTQVHFKELHNLLTKLRTFVGSPAASSVQKLSMSSHDDDLRLQLKKLNEISLGILESPVLKLNCDPRFYALQNHHACEASVVNVVDKQQSKMLKSYFVRVGLGVAFSAAVGGLPSLTGTGPNVILASTVSENDSLPDLDWGSFFIFGFPISMVMLGTMFLCLALIRFPKGLVIDIAIMQHRLKEMGHVNRAEAITLASVAILVSLWLFRKPGWLPDNVGWAVLMPEPTYVSDATAAMLISFLLFVIPGRIEKCNDRSVPSEISEDLRSVDTHFSSAILSWEYFIQKFPHSLVLLIAGGCAVSEGFSSSGLTDLIVTWVTDLEDKVSGLVLMLTLMMAATALSQFTSNGASASILLPLAASVARAIGLDERAFMVPTALACSLAFLLPISTPPNAIVYEAGLVSPGTMFSWGIVFSAGGILIIFVGMIILSKPILDVSLYANTTMAKEARRLGSVSTTMSSVTDDKPVLEILTTETTTTLFVPMKIQRKDPYVLDDVQEVDNIFGQERLTFI